MTASITSSRNRQFLWAGWTVLALLLLPIGNGAYYFAAVAASALGVAIIPGALPHGGRHRDDQDLVVILALYAAVVALNAAAFIGFTVDNVLGLFVCFAAALVLGVAAPIVYTVRVRHRSLDDLGLRRDNIKATLGFALAFAAAQLAVTLRGIDLPAPVDWVPLLAMSLVVGVFESVFFRGFVQTRLEAQFGTVFGIGAAAVLYGAYHVGYGMTGIDLLFLTGLGVVYAVAFAVARNLVALWPLLTPLGSFYAKLEDGDIELPWASIAGFADVLGLMILAWWLMVRYQRKTHGAPEPQTHARV
jgi:hypothetical protein